MTITSDLDFTSNRIRITLSEFLDFLVKSGSPKITVARNARIYRERKYSPQRDFHKIFRDCVKSHGCQRNPGDALERLLADHLHDNKVANYTEKDQADSTSSDRWCEATNAGYHRPLPAA